MDPTIWTSRKIAYRQGKSVHEQSSGRNFPPDVIKKVFRSPYHPQTDGFVEKLNLTLMKDMQAIIALKEEDWDNYPPIICYRYNNTINSTTKMTPFKAVFGEESFDFNAELGAEQARDRLKLSREKIVSRLIQTHSALLDEGLKARFHAGRYYNKLVTHVSFEIGDRVMIYFPQLDKRVGRKLSTPWKGPYIVPKILSSIAYMVRSEKVDESARVHVNRLRLLSPNMQEWQRASGGVFPDSKRILRSVIAERRKNGNREFKVSLLFNRAHH